MEQREILEKLNVETLRDMIVDLWAGIQKMDSNHENYREWTNIIENQYYDRMKELEEKLKPIPLKDKFTQGLQFQVAKINELEKRLKDNHGAEEAIIKSREKLISHLQNELKELTANSAKSIDSLCVSLERERQANVKLRDERDRAERDYMTVHQDTLKAVFNFILTVDPNYPHFAVHFAKAIKDEFALEI